MLKQALEGNVTERRGDIICNPTACIWGGLPSVLSNPLLKRRVFENNMLLLKFMFLNWILIVPA